jgi:pyruvate ferredoxin oxidoreductase gamma subunit
VFQVRIHGRGGQGVVTAAELVSVAAFQEGKHAQAFPSFGSERMGAPVVAFCRIDDKEIRAREPIAAPDVVIVQDPTLLHAVSVFDGLNLQGFVLLNTAKPLESLGIDEDLQRFGECRWQAVPATELALRHVGRPIPNAALLGALAALTGAVGLPAVEAAIRARFPGAVGEKNVEAARAAYELVAASEKELQPC